MGLVFISSALGIPPFYVITILAGAVRLRFGRFIAVGACGRVLRFGALILVPQLAIRLFHCLGG
jgi:membrane protein YqaA with SNARE-associated domain